MRERIVNLKLNPIAHKIKGKRLVILDDSIVRGTTSKLLIKILKEAGAKEIHFRSASPPIIAPCFLGIDMPTKADLISANMSPKELVNYLEVDDRFLKLEVNKSNEEEEKQGNYTRKEFSCYSFQRNFALPQSGIDLDAISANYEDGILKIKLPKTSKEKDLVKKIQVR